MPKLSDRLISVEGKSEWRAHWLVVFASVVGLMIAQLHVYSLGVMIAPLEQEFGWGRAQISSGLLIISLFVFPLAPLMGVAIDRYGPRRVALCGVTIYSLSIAFLSLAQQHLWTWWLLWLFVASGSLFLKATVWVSAVTSFFAASRGLALAVTLCAGGLTSSIGPLLTVFLLQNFGWRGAYISLGALIALTALPILFLFFSSAQDKSRTDTKKGDSPKAAVATTPFWRHAMSNPALRKALVSPPFIRLVVIALIMSITSLTLVINLVPILTSSGIDLTRAAAIVGLVGISSITGRLSSGFLLDHFDARWIGACVFAMPFVTCLILLFAAGSTPLAIIAIVVFGLSLGAEVDVIAYLAARFFRAENFGAIFGVIVGTLALGGGVGPILSGLVYDLTGSYRLALWVIIPLSLLSGYLILTLSAYPKLESATAETQGHAGAPAR